MHRSKWAIVLLEQNLVVFQVDLSAHSHYVMRWLYLFTVLQYRDAEVEASESNFVVLVQSLLKDPIERECFFQVILHSALWASCRTALLTPRFYWKQWECHAREKLLVQAFKKKSTWSYNPSPCLHLNNVPPTGGVPGTIWPTLWHSGTDVNMGVPLQTGTTVSSTRPQAGIEHCGMYSFWQLSLSGIGWCMNLAQVGNSTFWEDKHNSLGYGDWI